MPMLLSKSNCGHRLLLLGRSNLFRDVTILNVLALVLIPCIALAETSLEFVPRIEVAQPSVKQELYLRLAADHSHQVSSGRFGLASYRMRIEGFVTRDFAEENIKPFGKPDLRKSRDEADLNEAWFDLSFANSFAIRVGRQPIRWSQSWTLPSLDLLSGRRFNRFFLDPLIDQLTHPDAIRLNYSGTLSAQTWDIDLVQVLASAPFKFAEPLRNRDRENLGETAVKIGTKLGLLEIAAVGSTKKIPGTNRRESQAGLLASYAFENFVVKSELGNSDRNAAFFTLGTDWFIEEWIVGPQVSILREPARNSSGEALFYLPIRYNRDPWLLETDILIGFGDSVAAGDRYLAFRIGRELGRELGQGLVLSFGLQNYAGNAGRLLGQAKSVLGEVVYGLRLEYSGGGTL